jgi:hypothetical protein
MEQISGKIREGFPVFKEKSLIFSIFESIGGIPPSIFAIFNAI